VPGKYDGQPIVTCAWCGKTLSTQEILSMTQNLEQISAELAQNMVSCAENNLRRVRDVTLLQHILEVSLDELSLMNHIMSVKEVQKIIVDFYGFNMKVPE
jgi:hypothetical protein